VTTNVTVAEVADTREQQPQQQQPPQSKGNVGAGRRIANQNVALSNGSSGISNVGRVTPRSHMEQEKRIRREIANSNERRRMQSINAGFQSLRTLLPHHEGEKLSKVSRVAWRLSSSNWSREAFTTRVTTLNRRSSPRSSSFAITQFLLHARVEWNARIETGEISNTPVSSFVPFRTR